MSECLVEWLDSQYMSDEQIAVRNGLNDLMRRINSGVGGTTKERALQIAAEELWRHVHGYETRLSVRNEALCRRNDSDRNSPTTRRKSDD